MDPEPRPTATAATATLSERESKELVAAFGVPVPREETATDPDAAVAAAGRVGYPAVLKLCGPRITHKTERGLVRLHLADPAAVRAAAEDLLGAVTPDDGEVELLVAPMVRGTRELIAGIARDAQFGACVMLGFGGVLAEALQDVVFRLVPVDEIDAEEMIDDLRTQALLGPFRGEPPVDRAALRAVLVGLSALAAAENRVVSVDLNPLVVVEGRPVAVDALVEVTA